jgi:branched-chain amino acid transport system permease protein
MTTFLQLGFAGLALGAIYALIAIGFAIIYKASRVINFAQGELLLVGAYLISSFTLDWKIPFVLAVAFALAITAGIGVLFQRVVLSRMVGRPVFAIVMITIGLDIILRSLVTVRWGYDVRLVGDPWGSSGFSAGGVRFDWVAILTIGATAMVVALLFLFFRYSRYGVAIRATALDQEAALAVGIRVSTVYALAWAIAAVVATIGGLFLAGYPRNLDPTAGFVALRAFPAIIVGGLDSTLGALVGGLLIGLIEVLTAGYQPQFAPWLGKNFYAVAAYVVMLGVLLVRPYGLFGTPEVERV